MRPVRLWTLAIRTAPLVFRKQIGQSILVLDVLNGTTHLPLQIGAAIKAAATSPLQYYS